MLLLQLAVPRMELSTATNTRLQAPWLPPDSGATPGVHTVAPKQACRSASPFAPSQRSGPPSQMQHAAPTGTATALDCYSYRNPCARVTSHPLHIRLPLRLSNLRLAIRHSIVHVDVDAVWPYSGYKVPSLQRCQHLQGGSSKACAWDAATTRGCRGCCVGGLTAAAAAATTAGRRVWQVPELYKRRFQGEQLHVRHYQKCSTHLLGRVCQGHLQPVPFQYPQEVMEEVHRRGIHICGKTIGEEVGCMSSIRRKSWKKWTAVASTSAASHVKQGYNSLRVSLPGN